MSNTVSLRALRHAAERFHDLMGHSAAKESDFQALFAENPCVLASTLPLRLEPSDIIPLGRPGRSEPDFVAYPRQNGLFGNYAIIELKRPTSTILSTPRRGVITLSRDAQTALAQSEVQGAAWIAEDSHPPATEVLTIGNSRHIFIIMGLSTELTQKLGSGLFAGQLAGLLPRDCQLIPYDTLYRSFTAMVPPSIMVLVPAGSSRPDPTRLTIRSLPADGLLGCAISGELMWDSVPKLEGYFHALIEWLNDRQLFLDIAGLTALDEVGARGLRYIHEDCTLRAVSLFVTPPSGQMAPTFARLGLDRDLRFRNAAQ